MSLGISTGIGTGKGTGIGTSVGRCVDTDANKGYTRMSHVP